MWGDEWGDEWGALSESGDEAASTSVESIDLELTLPDISPGPVITSVESIDLEVSLPSIVEPVVTSVESIDLELTLPDISPGPIITSVGSIDLELTLPDMPPPDFEEPPLPCIRLVVIPPILHGRYFNKIRLISLAQKSATITSIAQD